MPVTNYDYSLCTYCSSDPFSQSLRECVRTLFACTNCRADIVSRGGGTGQGWMALMRLSGMYSLCAVRQEWTLQSKPPLDAAHEAALYKALEDPGHL